MTVQTDPKDQTQTVLAKRPANAKALIVAVLLKDESDPMTDYFHASPSRYVAIGWRTTTRESFPQMRKAAASFEPTTHLGPGRDKWTVGLVWDHDSSDEAAKAQAFLHTTEIYHKGWKVQMTSSDTPEHFGTEAEADAWVAETPAPARTYWEKNCESFEHREKYSMGGGYYLMDGWHRRGGWMVSAIPLRDDGTLVSSLSVLEDAIPEPGRGTPAASVGGASIERHTHTKRNFEMWLVIPSQRLDRERFEQLRDAVKAVGGWYSRKWGKTPGGFAFTDASVAEQFAREYFGTNSDPSPSGPNPTKPSTSGKAQDGEKIAAKLEGLAGGLQDQIDHKRRPMTQNPTPKRNREYGSRLHDADNLERGQRAMRALAEAHRKGDVPAALARLTTKNKILPLVAKGLESGGGYYDVIPSDRYSRDNEQAVALQALLEASATDAQRKADETKRQADHIGRLEGEVRFLKIPGYFRTPVPVIDRMLEHADIRFGMRILEPSAGDGAIVDRIRELHGDWIAGQVDACERNHRLREILGFKAHAAILDGDDFLSLDLGPSYDLVLMNPPFEKGQDLEHVCHAFDCLKPGGQVVAIMSAGGFYRSDAKAVGFREWFDGLNGYREALPEGAFSTSGTSVSTVLVTIDKPA